MIDTLFNAIIPLTLVLACILFFHQILLKGFGANNTYYMWLVVPLSMVFYLFVPTVLFTKNNEVLGTQLEKMIVQSSQVITNVSSINWLVIGYLMVVMFFILLGFINHFTFQRKLNLPSNDGLKTNGNINCDALNIQLPRKLNINVSHRVQSPMIAGFINPQLLLPTCFSELYNIDQQRLILEHEICHFDRNDIYWNLLAYVFLTLFWFHPLVWLAYFRFRQDQELSCDQTVLARKHLDSRINYSRALLVTAQYKPSLAIARISFNEYGDKAIMLERINQIKSTRMIKKTHTVSLAIAGAIMLSGLSYAGNVDKAGVHANHAKSNEVYPIMRVEPKYPVDAAKNNVEGAVLLKFDINGNGETENIKVVNAQPAYVFDQVAIKALSQWKYKVAQKTTSHDYIVQLDFRMDNSSSKPFHLIERINVTK